MVLTAANRVRKQGTLATTKLTSHELSKHFTHRNLPYRPLPNQRGIARKHKLTDAMEIVTSETHAKGEGLWIARQAHSPSDTTTDSRRGGSRR